MESPLESKSSFIRRINSTMAIVFGPSEMTNIGHARERRRGR